MLFNKTRQYNIYIFDKIIFVKSKLQKQIGRKEGNVLFNDTLNTFYFTVIWRRTYGKGPLKIVRWKPAAATWATLSG